MHLTLRHGSMIILVLLLGGLAIQPASALFPEPVGFVHCAESRSQTPQDIPGCQPPTGYIVKLFETPILMACPVPSMGYYITLANVPITQDCYQVVQGSCGTGGIMITLWENTNSYSQCFESNCGSGTNGVRFTSSMPPLSHSLCEDAPCPDSLQSSYRVDGVLVPCLPLPPTPNPTVPCIGATPILPIVGCILECLHLNQPSLGPFSFPCLPIDEILVCGNAFLYGGPGGNEQGNLTFLAFCIITSA